MHCIWGRFAPNLRVGKLYGHPRAEAIANLDKLDVAITSPHAMPVHKTTPTRVHRLILDESHLYEPGSGSSMHGQVEVVSLYYPTFMWCVTGTPFSTSLKQLSWQAMMLGQYYHGLALKHMAGSHRSCVTADPSQTHADTLRCIMIRHTKTQRINGAVSGTQIDPIYTLYVLTCRIVMLERARYFERYTQARPPSHLCRAQVALALPDTDSETVWLDFSEDERQLYQRAACFDGVPSWSSSFGMGGGGHAGSLSELTGLTFRLRAAAGLHSNKHSHRCQAPDNAVLVGGYRPGRGSYNGGQRIVWADDASEPFWRLVKKPDGDAPDVPFGGLAHLPRLMQTAKYRAFLADLDALRASQPNVSVVAFTQFQEVHAALTEILAERGGFTIFAVSKKTHPMTRHKAIKEFQKEAAAGEPPKIFICTYDVCAVG